MIRSIKNIFGKEKEKAKYLLLFGSFGNGKDYALFGWFEGGGSCRSSVT